MTDTMPGENAKTLKPKPQMNMKLTAGVIVVIVIAIVAAIAVGGKKSNNSDSPTDQPGGVESVEQMEERLASIDYDKVALLEDVTGGDATGMAYYFFDDAEGFYNLTAQFEGLPEIDLDKEFYEGWIVKTTTGEFKSTGELTEIDGQLINTFRSKRNYNTYDRYVLTIEPRDNDPAPADHVMEGDFLTELPKDTMMDSEDKMDDSAMPADDSMTDETVVDETTN